MEKTKLSYVDHFDEIPKDALCAVDEAICLMKGLPIPKDDYAVSRQGDICDTSYRYSMPQWCLYDVWTKEEAARLASGLLPLTDSMGEEFEKTCWDVFEGLPIGKFAVSKILQHRFDHAAHVYEILNRSALGETATPREWVGYLHSKGLLPPEDMALEEIDFTPMLALLENEDGQSQDLPHTTKWLEIQKAAIREFFYPRPELDVKSEVVIPWIEEEAKKAGLTGSNRIASAMFTMIKPEDHDPRNKRVQPKEDQ